MNLFRASKYGLSALVGLSLLSTAAQAQITNGDFKTNTCQPPLPAGYTTLSYGDICISGWTVGDGTATPFRGGSVDLYSSVLQAPGGTSRVIDLDGFNPGSINQTINTTPGTAYIVNFALSGNPGGSSSPVKTLMVQTTPNTSATYSYNTSTAGNTLSDMRYVYKSFQFTATSTLTIISFQSQDDKLSNSGPVIGDISIQVTPSTYYFPQIAVGGGFQTTLTYINYSPEAVTCVTQFYSDSGSPLPILFSQGSVSSRTDILQPGQSIHDQTTASSGAAGVGGWALGSCTARVQASVLYRLYQGGVPVGEASVIAETAPTTVFATYAQTQTGIAYANPSTTQPVTVTITAYSTSGARLASQFVAIGPLGHGAANLGPLLGLQSFTGFVKIVATLPIVSISLNAEAFPAFSSLPPGDLPPSTSLVP